jgi:malto-oligosyltrehalose trehalohydrolase
VPVSTSPEVSAAFGPELSGSGAVRFRIYAPSVNSVQLSLEKDGVLLDMAALGDGWFEVETPLAFTGTRYRFRLPDGSEVPDPGSRYQPEDVHGPSEVIDPNGFSWQDAGWRGRPWHEAILYELHIGTFTKEGTFRTAIEQLKQVAELGVTAIELMCLADFAGNRNWGYDGVLLYAPDSAYGRPEDMKAFIDAAHALGVMVILDVVYNHLGPEGNYIPKYFPQMLTDRHVTPWGQAFNFDGEHSKVVREMVIQNALYWVTEFHVDGLRLDASHAMIDDSPRHVLDELRERVLAAAGERTIHLILENEQNISRQLRRHEKGDAQGYTAQWNHDITHLLGAVLSNLCSGEDLSETEKLGKALAQGFVIAAQMEGKADPCSHVPPTAFLSFIQTHDLVGNRIFGDRIASLTSPVALRAIAAIYLLLPQIPMLFMGEEWAASTPFPYFCDYHGELAEAVRQGRCEQLSKLDPAPSAEEMERAPDPQADSTLRSAQLRWEEIVASPHAEWLDWYKRVLGVRREAIIPLLAGLSESCGHYEVIAPGALTARWSLAGGAELRLAANLCGEARSGFPLKDGRILWTEGALESDRLGAWGVRWRTC